MSTRGGLARGGYRLEATRARLIARDGLTCGRCGGRMDPDLSGLNTDGITVGHIVPAARGGMDDDANLRLEHRRCNLAAGDRRDPPRATLAVPPVFSDVGDRAAAPSFARNGARSGLFASGRKQP